MGAILTWRKSGRITTHYSQAEYSNSFS